MAAGTAAKEDTKQTRVTLWPLELPKTSAGARRFSFNVGSDNAIPWSTCKPKHTSRWGGERDAKRHYQGAKKTKQRQSFTVQNAGVEE